MNIEEFQDFTENIWIRAGNPGRHDGGMMEEISSGLDGCFVDGDGEATIANIETLIHSMQQDLTDFENAMQHVIDDGEMGL